MTLVDSPQIHPFPVFFVSGVMHVCVSLKPEAMVVWGGCKWEVHATHFCHLQKSAKLNNSCSISLLRTSILNWILLLGVNVVKTASKVIGHQFICTKFPASQLNWENVFGQESFGERDLFKLMPPPCSGASNGAPFRRMHHRDLYSWSAFSQGQLFTATSLMHTPRPRVWDYPSSVQPPPRPWVASIADDGDVGFSAKVFKQAYGCTQSPSVSRVRNSWLLVAISG